METTVIFDLDGVLVDSRAAIAGCMNHALTAHRAARRTRKPICTPTSARRSRTRSASCSGWRRSDPEVAAMMTAYRERYATVSLTDTTVEPGIPEALDGSPTTTGWRSRRRSRRRSPSRCSTPSG